MLAHHILLSSAAVVSPYAFPSLHKAVFFTCFPVDKRELNHIASFVCGNLESFEVHAIPEVYKNVSFSLLRNTEMRNIAPNCVQRRYRVHSIPV